MSGHVSGTSFVHVGCFSLSEQQRTPYFLVLSVSIETPSPEPSWTKYCWGSSSSSSAVSDVHTFCLSKPHPVPLVQSASISATVHNLPPAPPQAALAPSQLSVRHWLFQAAGVSWSEVPQMSGHVSGTSFVHVGCFSLSEQQRTPYFLVLSVSIETPSPEPSWTKYCWGPSSSSSSVEGTCVDASVGTCVSSWSFNKLFFDEVLDTWSKNDLCDWTLIKDSFFARSSLHLCKKVTSSVCFVLSPWMSYPSGIPPFGISFKWTGAERTGTRWIPLFKLIGTAHTRQVNTFRRRNIISWSSSKKS